MENKYSQDPTVIEQGDTFDERGEVKWSQSWQVCKTCFQRISQPVLKGIWYHSLRTGSSIERLGNPDHPAIPASPLEQLFERFCSDSVYDKKKKCKHYFHWRDTLELKLVQGFIGDHWVMPDGITACGKIFADIVDFHKFKDAVTEYPTKQGYSCPDCMKKLVRKKLVKQIAPTGKNKNEIFNKLEWIGVAQ